ncbi:putative ribosome biogenesis protein [Candidatus Nitrososphaera gargensis Ga9.2]|uniref:Ribosomal RNA small subunit methyltransferase Nep1 n=1 Tax=Nitrososphaera gargensis (strain Ga9.2) TaxID=1237085 RepID=K0I722_NITGG|nr:ribosome biogenesis protein [Candidatus Nitrososphaera gargensis]AFU57066.1 putative ribosome biogenesis protein [Candidatus Nitrososphaera gargensis Ga9.2]
MTTLIIAEAALETVPCEIINHPAVRNHARRLGLKPSETLLDRSYHHAAMSKLQDNGRRGRPDIVHFALMEALGTPLFLRGMLKVYVHTVNDRLITIADNLRIPKSYFRFEGLMVSLFRDKVIKSDEGRVLMEISDGTLADLVNAIRPSRVIGLSRTGIQGTAEKAVAENLADDGCCAFVVGGFPRGHFSESTTRLLNLTYSISDIGLEAHVVIARVLYECEKFLLEKGIHHEGDEKRRQVGT